MTTTTSAAKILGTTDEVTTCDCCGRQDLTKTVAIEIDGETAFYGVVCAANLMARTAKQIKSAAQHADAVAAEMRRRERQARHQAEFARTQAKLDGMFPELTGNRFEQVRRLISTGISLSTI